MRLLLLAAALALTACGQPSAPQPSTETGAAAPARALPPDTATEDTAELQTRVASLAAPHNEASFDAGKRVFAQCRSCHSVEAGGGNRVGPNLHGVFDREVGTAPGFSYSQAVQDADFRWDADHLEHWLSDPRGFLPGNRMAFMGVHDPIQRRDLIAYLMVESDPQH